MNTKTPLPFLVLLSLSSMCPTTASAQVGGTTGGGVAVMESKKLLLRDLVDGCETKVTSTLIKSFHLENEVASIFGALKENNGYMAYRLKKEFYRMTWCLSEKRLTPITSNDEDSTFFSYDPEYQVGLRNMNQPQAFIDLGYFKQMLTNEVVHDSRVKYNQTMFLIHETLHSFLKKDQHDRKQALRSLTRAIFLNLDHAAQESLADRKLDLDAAIGLTETESEFASSVFADAFNHYFEHEDEQSAQFIEQYSITHAKAMPNDYFEILGLELGKLSLMATQAFQRHLNWLPALFRFQAWVELSNDFKSKGSQSLLVLPRQFNLGTCQVKRSIKYKSTAAPYDGGVNEDGPYARRGMHYGIHSLQLNFTVNFPSPNQAPFVFSLIDNENIVDFLWRIFSWHSDPEAVNRYEVGVDNFLSWIRKGACNNKTEENLQYY